MAGVRSSTTHWKEGGSYYTERPEMLRAQPLLPDLVRLRDRRLLGLFERYGSLGVGSHVLEVGCGRSPWLPYLVKRWGCSVAGIDIEPFAAELARANLLGAGANGQIYCRDAFALEENRDILGKFDLVYSMGVIEHFDDAVERLAVLARFLKPGGRILTTVPNMRGVNWLVQRFADVEILEMHVIYDPERLARVHESAGFESIEKGYVGFYDGFLTSAGRRAGRIKVGIHQCVCWASSMCSEAWGRALGGLAAPELSWAAPHVFYAGRPSAGA